MYPTVPCSTLFNSQDMEIAYMSIYQGTDESDVVQIYNGILLNHKNNETPICSNMGGPKDCHTE